MLVFSAKLVFRIPGCHEKKHQKTPIQHVAGGEQRQGARVEVPKDTELLLPCCETLGALGMPGMALEARFSTRFSLSFFLTWQWKFPYFQDRKYIFLKEIIIFPFVHGSFYWRVVEDGGFLWVKLKIATQN